MDPSRRGFVKGTGLAALGLASGAVIDSLAAPGSALQQSARPGVKRLALVIDLGKFFNNQRQVQLCIEACHEAHNVPRHARAKDQIEWIWQENFHTAFHEQELTFVREDLEQTPTLLLCNHCDNPPCTKVCPTKATWKRESDGVVMMDWHRCIGCRYCMVGCPYGSRSFNWINPRLAENLNDEGEIDPSFPTRMKGVVEKCNLCEERLAKGQLPACVEACADDEIVFGDLNDPDSAVRQLLQEHFTIRRKPGLGTSPEVYYIVDTPGRLTGPGVVMDEGGEVNHA